MSNSADVLLQAPPAQLFGSSKSIPKEKLQWQANTNHEVYFMCYPGSRSQKFGNCTSSSSSLPGTTTAINQEMPKINNSEGRPEGGSSASASSLKLDQATATSATLTVHPQTTSLPGTPSKLNNDQTLPNSNSEAGAAGPQRLSASTDVDTLKINETATTASISLPTQITSLPVATDHNPAPENDVTNHSVVKNEQSSTVTAPETEVEENPDPVKPLQQDDEKQRVCKTCESKYEKEENTSNVEEWLYSDTCTNCQKVILNYHRSISRLQSPNRHTTTNYHHEEEVDSCCCF